MREALTKGWLRLRALARPRQHDRDLEDELAFHLAMREAAHREAGLSADEARLRARREFGRPAHVKESMRDLWQWGFLDRAWQDLRFAFRSARRQPAFTAIVILTLALGIGATTAMFSILDAVLLRPFPFPRTDQLVVVWEVNRERNIDRFVGSPANYADWLQAATGFSDLGAWELRDDNRTDGARPEQVQGALASSALFRALQVQASVGRVFTQQEDRPDNRHVALLGHEYWQRAFGGDPRAVGRAVIVNGESYAIVGVLPALRAPLRADIWRPLAPDVAALDRGDHSLNVIGRLAPGASAAQAEASLRTVASRLEAAYPTTNRGWSVRVESLFDALVSPGTRRAMLVLMGAVGLLLLIACVNVANLLLARATGRQREMSTRLALGAARGRLVRQLLTESAVLSCAGGLAGLLVAAWGLRLVQWLYPADINGLADASLNPYALLFALATSIVTTLTVGLVPAWQASRITRRGGGLQPTPRASTDAPRARQLRHGLVIAEIALALVLLIGAGLLLRSVDRLRGEALGFAPDRVLTAKIGLYGEKYDSLARYAGFLDSVLEDLGSRPGVAAAGVASSVPFGGGYTVMQARPSAASEGLQASWRVIGGNYLDAMGIPLKAGRAFRADDDARRPTRVAIINDALARRLWPGENPIGRRLLASNSRRPYEVVGLIGPSRLTGLGRAEEPVMYFHYRQFGWPAMTIVARAANNPASGQASPNGGAVRAPAPLEAGSAESAALESAVRQAVAAADREQPVFDVSPMRDLVERAAGAPRMNAALLTLFAALALGLSAIGVYGVMSYSAAQRTNEIGLRLALGAPPRAMLLLVWRRGLALTAIGLGLGLGTAWLSGRALAALLYEVSALDPVTYAAAFGLMLVVALLACYLPARRAMRIDPVIALRHD